MRSGGWDKGGGLRENEIIFAFKIFLGNLLNNFKTKRKKLAYLPIMLDLEALWAREDFYRI